MNEMQRLVVDGVIHAKQIEARVASEVGSVEKPQGFFNELGAPEEEVFVEKPGGLFNTDESKRVNRGGRPTVFTPELKERLEMLLSVGMSRRQASAYLNLDHTTVAKLAARDKDFALSLQNAEERASVNPLLTIVSESRKNWRAAAWLLKYRGSLPVEKVEKTEEEIEEEKQREHQRRLADDAREAERTKRWFASSREAIGGSQESTSKASSGTVTTIRHSKSKSKA